MHFYQKSNTYPPDGILSGCYKCRLLIGWLPVGTNAMLLAALLASQGVLFMRCCYVLEYQLVPVNSGYWWCSKLKNLSETYLEDDNDGDWWYTHIQQLKQIARIKGKEVDDEHLRKTLKGLSEIYSQEEEMDVNPGEWWSKRINLLTDNWIGYWWYSRLKGLPERYSQETPLTVNAGEWFSNQIQLLLEISKSQRMNFNSGFDWIDDVLGLDQKYSEKKPLPSKAEAWWSRNIKELIQPFVVKGVRMEVNPGLWWCRQIQTLIENWRGYWWYSRLKGLPESYSREAPLNPGDWYCSKIQELIQTTDFKEAPLNAGDWYCIKIQELIQTTDFKGMQVDYDDWWHNELKRRFATYLQVTRNEFSANVWWCSEIEQLLEWFYVKGMQVYYDDWWHNELKRLFAAYLQVAKGMRRKVIFNMLNDFRIERREDSVLQVAGNQISTIDWWCSETKQLIESFCVTEMLVNIRDSWSEILEEQSKQEYFIKLSKFVYEERQMVTVYPPADQVFRWTNFCDPHKVKAVIFGQDPYFNPDEAHGLCFSVQKGVKIPPSLKKIFKELEREFGVGFQRPDHGSLEGWAKQGVLLLNMCLTVREGVPDSHQQKGWEDLIKAIIDWLVTYRSNIVFMLWGENAHDIEDYIENEPSLCNHKEKHHILTAAHPVYFGRLVRLKPFQGCNHFIECNDYLRENFITPIDWSYLP